MGSNNQSYEVKISPAQRVLEYLYNWPGKSVYQISLGTNLCNIANVEAALRELEPIIKEGSKMIKEGRVKGSMLVYSIDQEKVEKWRVLLGMIPPKYKKPKGSPDIPPSLRRQIEDRKKRRYEHNRRMNRERARMEKR